MLSRLFGKRSEKKTTSRFPHLPGGREVPIAGSEYAPKRITRALNGDHTFELRREPRNRAHSNAVMVLLKGQHLGYVPAWYADDLSPILRGLGHHRVRCRGSINVRRDPYQGMLELPEATALHRWIAEGHKLTDDDPGNITVTRHTVPVKRPKDYQERLEQLLGGDADEAFLPVTFEIKDTPRGKYAGEPHIYVLHKGDILGELPAQYRYQDDRHEMFYGMILNGDLSTCTARLQRNPDSLILVRLYEYVPSWS